MKDTIRKATSATLGVTKPGTRYINRDTWLWNDDVEMKVREKKRLDRKFLDDKTLGNWQIYKNANRQAKKAVAVTRPDTATEVEEGIKRMKSGKATGPDDIASELWKAKCWDPTLWLSEFFNRVIQEGRTSSDWQEITTVPIWKKKIQQNVQITVRSGYFNIP